jgi:hypothetical protein
MTHLSKTLSHQAGLILGLALPVAAWAQTASYYGGDLLATNFVMQPGATNLSGANYPPGQGQWMSTKGVDAVDPNATGVTFQFLTAQVGKDMTNAVTAQSATSFSATIATALDDAALARNWPPATNAMFSLTNLASSQTNPASCLVFVPASNFLGAKWFKLVSLNYQGTNALRVQARAGFWTQ